MRTAVVLLAVCCCLSAVTGQWLETTRLASSPGPISGTEALRQARASRSFNQPMGSSTPSLDDEFLIDTSFTVMPAPNGQTMPAVAFDGESFLVVWADHRVGLNDCDIYGTRVTPQGDVLDRTGFVISQGARDQQFPEVSFDGACFLVVWQDSRTGSADVYGARVTRQGAVLDSAGLVISQATNDQLSPAVCSDDSGFFVVWQDSRGGSPDIYGARVTFQGTVLDSAGVAISRTDGDQRSPAVGLCGSSFLVVWESIRNGSADVYGARVTSQGALLDSTGFVISQAAYDQGAPVVGSSGSSSLVVWEDCRSGSADVYGARVTSQGAVLDSAGLAISQAAEEQFSPSVEFDGTNFLVAWQDYRSAFYSDLFGARVTPQGTVLDTAGVAISLAGSHQYAPALSFDGANFLVAWSDTRGDNEDIYGARVTPQGTVLDTSGILVSTAASEQWSPALAFDGASFLVVWRDYRTGSSDIRGARVTPQGTVLDPVGFVISQAVRAQCSPAVGHGGDNFLVVWEDYRSGRSDIYGARVTSQGEVLDTQGLVISEAANDQLRPELSFEGANFLVVWEDLRSGIAAIYGARVTPQGAVLDTQDVVISTGANGHNYPALGFDGTDFLVVWQDWRDGLDIYGARVTQQGAVLDSAGFAISQARQAYFPVLGFDGANFLVVWDDNQNGYPGATFGARVTPQGGVIDSAGIYISEGLGDQRWPTLSFDGADFLVAWQDSRSGSDWDVYGARVTTGGSVFDSGPIVRIKGDQSGPKLCCGNAGRTLLVYQGWAGVEDDRSYNTCRIWGTMNQNPAVVEVAKPKSRMTDVGATIIRGVLFLPRSSNHLIPRSLLDISGRKVMDLKPGANDVRALAPGVYFVRGEGRGTGDEGRIRKVVVTR